MDSQTKLAHDLMRLFRMDDAEAPWPAIERVRYKQRLGVRDGQGEFTWAGEGKSEPLADSLAAFDARPAGFARLPDALDRLLWFLRETDKLVLDGLTAEMITGSPEVGRLIRTIGLGLRSPGSPGSAAWLERWSDQGSPAELDPEIHTHRVVGVRLTDAGRARAEAIARRLAGDRSIDALAM